MLLATVFFAGRQWLPWTGLILVLMVALLIWAYRQGPAVGPVRSICIALKLLGIAALLACLLEPLLSGQRPKPGSNIFAIVADNSQGMQIKDSNATESRGALLKKLLTDNESGWQEKLDKDFQLRRYLFDARLQSTKDYSELNFDGRASSIATAIQGVAERFRGQPLAGILLFTDGNATDIGDTLPDLTGLPPVYPVVSGTDLPVKDLAIAKVATTQTVFEDAPVSVQADVLAVGYSGKRIVAELLDVGPTNPPVVSTNKTLNAAAKAKAASTNSVTSVSGAPGKVLASQTMRIVSNNEVAAFRFNVRPEQSGLSFLRLRVTASDETEQFEHPEKSTEATLANNHRVMVVDRGRGPYNVLYVTGRPNWEYKFLNRAVDDDDQVRMVAMVRVAKREKKFDFMGRKGETSNPLYRGFGNQSKEEVEQYDKPVIVRLNTKDKDELLTGFPKTPEELYPFHALIIGDLESEFFTAEQMTLVQKFVSERGGGFLMLGGAESYYDGKYQHTPIGDMLPVYTDRGGEGKPPEQWRMNLSREGWLQPWARLRNNENDERTRINDMPSFLVANDVHETKPGATIIANITDPSGKDHPALAVQRFGRGRTGALMIGDLWHWGLRDKDAHADLDKAWRQMVRWLVSDVPGQVEVTAQPIPGDPNQAIQLQVRARDKKFQPLDAAAVAVTVKLAADTEPQAVQKPGAENATPPQPVVHEIKIMAEPSLTEPGVYQATYVPRRTGGYLAEATVTDSAGVEVGKSQVGWASDPAADEFRSLKPNRQLLENIAHKTGGEIIAPDKLKEFAQKLPSKKAPIMESYTNPIWHTPMLFGFALLCFASEWGLRRLKGFA